MHTDMLARCAALCAETENQKIDRREQERRKGTGGFLKAKRSRGDGAGGGEDEGERGMGGRQLLWVNEAPRYPRPGPCIGTPATGRHLQYLVERSE